MEQFKNRLKQYGLRLTLSQAFRKAIRGLYQFDRNIAFVIPQFFGHGPADPCIKPLTRERVSQASQKGELKESEVQLLTGFLADGLSGLCAEIDGRLAGYAWVQFEGLYTYGCAGRMAIPPKHAVAKNLLVFPAFRGHKLGPKLNSARLTLIPPGHVPVAFIIPENRYAIRNWEQYGFQRVFMIKHWRWFRGRWQMRIDRLADGVHADALEQALTEGHRPKQPGT